MALYYNDICIRPNKFFTVYFVLMSCFYTNTLIQLAAQLLILAYVFYPFIKSEFTIKHSKFKNVLFCLVWFGLLTIAFYASKKWAYSVNPESKTMLTMFRILIIGVAIFYYTDSTQRALSILQSFMIGVVAMGILAIITAIVYRQPFFSTAFGTAIGQHRNQIGAVAAPLFFVCLRLKKNNRFRNGGYFAAFFLILTIITGSRTSILQIAVLWGLYVLLGNANASRKLKNIVIFFFAIIIAAAIVMNVPVLYNQIGQRLYSVIASIIGNDYTDASVAGRDYYKYIAGIMFRNKPLLGYGLDGFYCYLRDNPFIITGMRLAAVYAHCNYAELAADLGLLGLVIWYMPVLLTLYKGLRKKNYNIFGREMSIVFLSMVLMDYSRIPWETHLVMYLFFIIIIICRYETTLSEDGINQ